VCVALLVLVVCTLGAAVLVACLAYEVGRHHVFGSQGLLLKSVDEITAKDASKETPSYTWRAPNTARVHEVRTATNTPQPSPQDVPSSVSLLGIARFQRIMIQRHRPSYNGIARDPLRPFSRFPLILPQHCPRATRDLESRTSNTIDISPLLEKSFFFLLSLHTKLSMPSML
jgi:hypothetical protein